MAGFLHVDPGGFRTDLLPGGKRSNPLNYGVMVHKYTPSLLTAFVTVCVIFSGIFHAKMN